MCILYFFFQESTINSSCTKMWSIIVSIIATSIIYGYICSYCCNNVLYYIILYCIVWYCIVVLYCVLVLYCIVLYCIVDKIKVTIPDTYWLVYKVPHSRPALNILHTHCLYFMWWYIFCLTLTALLSLHWNIDSVTERGSC